MYGHILLKRSDILTEIRVKSGRIFRVHFGESANAADACSVICTLTVPIMRDRRLAMVHSGATAQRGSPSPLASVKRALQASIWLRCFGALRVRQDIGRRDDFAVRERERRHVRGMDMLGWHSDAAELEVHRRTGILHDEGIVAMVR